MVNDYALPGTAQLANEAVKAFGANNCVFLKNHGLVTVGETIHEAFKIGNASMIPSEHSKALREKYLSSYRQE